MRFINRFYRILERKNYLAKMNNLPKHRGMGPQEARDPMQLHRVHRLKADPDHNSPECQATMKILMKRLHR